MDTFPPLPSERNFGWTFTVVGLLLAAYFAWGGQEGPASVAGLVALAFGGVTLVRPVVLRPLNRAWARLGLLLSKIVNPLVLGVIFFVIFTPVAWAMRLAGRDELALRTAPRTSYWKLRAPPGPPASSFDRQF